MRNSMSRAVWVLLTVFAFAAISSAAQYKVSIPRHKPCNVFAVGQPVAFDAEVAGPAGKAELAAAVTDYFGKAAWSHTQTLTLEAGKAAKASLDIGALPPGYYELTVNVPGAAAQFHLSPLVAYAIPCGDSS